MSKDRKKVSLSEPIPARHSHSRCHIRRHVRTSISCAG
jgi:hypothetical protein